METTAFWKWSGGKREFLQQFRALNHYSHCLEDTYTRNLKKVKSLNASGCQDRNFQSPRLAHRFIHDMGCRVIKCWTHLSNLRSNDLSMLQKIRSGHNCAQEITSAHIRETMPLQRDNAEGCPI